MREEKKYETNRAERVRQSVKLFEGKPLYVPTRSTCHRRPTFSDVSTTRRAVSLIVSCLIVILGQGVITDDEELIRKIHSNQGQGHLLLRRDADVMRWEEVLS